ncbi:MAG: DNA cytosine methyltransferase [Vicinamibacteria bacterium]
METPVIASEDVTRLTAIELCAGAGGQAIGLESAGFHHVALVELDPGPCATLRANRPRWPVIEADLRFFDAKPFAGVDLVAAGVPCPPFSKAGKQLGADDERDLFPEVLRIVRETRPRAVMIENVRGLLDERFADYRTAYMRSMRALDYVVYGWRLLQASHFGVPQLRPRAIFVAIRADQKGIFEWPRPASAPPPTVGDVLLQPMSSKGWRKAKAWARGATKLAPTLVGGSKKHGGPDLGPTRARNAWLQLGVNGCSLAEEPPARDFEGLPRLTVQMAAMIQGFPKEWVFSGKKTTAYRQVGNAFPPPVANAIGLALRATLEGRRTRPRQKMVVPEQRKLDAVA